MAIVESFRKWADLILSFKTLVKTDQKVFSSSPATRQESRTTNSQGGDWSSLILSMT